MEGIALTNFSFVNNTIKGVNEGVAGEAADVYIGNSVPVRLFQFLPFLSVAPFLPLLPQS
jgi:hypothetical protein